jgi:predicted RND superfamily exporter protein
VDAFHYGAFLENLDSRMREILGPEVSVEMTGATVLGNRTFSVVIVSMFRSYGLALLIITPLMIAMIGSLRIGLASMIPNLLPVYFTLALMGWLDIPLGMSTLLLGSIVIGVAVDDTIHFLHKFDGYHRTGGDAHAAIRRTLETTGTALFATSLVLAASFGCYTLGHMTGVVQFGILAPFAILIAFLADLILSPALLILVGRPKILG